MCNSHQKCAIMDCELLVYRDWNSSARLGRIKGRNMRFRMLVAGFVAMLASAPVFAQFVTYSTPTAPYTGSTTLMAIPGANFSTTTTLTDGTETLTFSATVGVRTVPGGGWATWASPPNVESATPKVLAVTTGLTSMTITLSTPSNTFGFEFEPNNGTQAITVTYYNGATVLGSIPLTVDYSSGARLFAANSTTPITHVVIAVPAGASGFAMAQFRYGTPPPAAATAVPTLSEWGLIVLSGLLTLGAIFVLRRQRN
jgi:hypothetical protein